MSGTSVGHDRAEPAGLLPLVALVALSVAVVPVLLHSLLFLFGLSLSVGSAVVGFALGLAAPVVLVGRRRELLVAYGVVLAFAVVALGVQSRSWDNHHDSLVHHEAAAIAIADGANPVYDDTGILWADHYPKAAWVFGASAYRLTGTIESGKVLTVLTALACFGVAASFFGSIVRRRRWLAYAAAALVALNPVTIVQLDTHYVDGLFANLGILLVLIAMAHRESGGLPGSSKRVTAALVVLAAVLIANLKFTGLVFVVLLGGIHVLAAYALAPRQRWSRHATLLAAAVALGVLLVGVDPYVTNTVGNGNPFYPVFGADLTDVPDPPDIGQRPTAYRDVPAPVAFLMSLADATRAGSQDAMPGEYSPKSPLSVTRDEIAAMTYPDARTGGFGPLFFAVLVGSCGLLVILATRRAKLENGAFARVGLWYGLALVVVLTLAMMEAWWARLAPVFYLAPVLVAVASASSGRRPARIAAAALLVALAANSGIAAAAQAFDYRNRQVTRSETLELLEGLDTAQIRFPDPWAEEHQARTFSRRLEDLGIAVDVVPYDEADSREWVPLPGQPAQLALSR